MLLLHKNINKQSTKVNKTLLSELPYFNYSDLISAHGQFNNSLSSPLPTNKYLDHLPSYYDLDLFTLNTFLDRSSNCNTYYSNTRGKYFSPHSFCDQKSKLLLRGVTETRINSSTENLDFNPSILHYNTCQRLFFLFTSSQKCKHNMWSIV